jgi:hypothetical protein
MAIQHRDIVDPEQHLPQSASTASADTVIKSDGAGGIVWELVDVDTLDEAAIQAWIEESIDTGDILLAERFYLEAVIPDIGAADFILVPILEDATFVGATLVIKGAITTTDTVISFVDATAASLGTSVTVFFDGSAEGDQYEFTASTNNELTGPTYIKIASDGATDATSVPAYLTLEFQRPIPV